jgi:YVTN family beta-propeller protein
MKTRNIALLVLSMAVVALLTALLVVSTVGAQPAGRNAAALQVAYPMTYQGRLTDNLGNPIANQTRNITFRIYEQPSGGTAVWEQVRAVQTDGGGLFTTVLEVDPPLGVADLSNVWFGIEVGSDGEMTPRQRVGGAPFAFTLVPGNGVTGTVDLGTWPSAIFGVFNTGTGHGLLARTDGEGVGMLGSSQAGFGGYFTSQEGHALAVNGPILFNTNLKRVALHRWYEANEAHVTFSVGGQPKGILFDGGSLWVTNSVSDTVTRRRASDGALMGVYPVGTYPIGMTYDGGRLWVANRGDDTVTRLVAATGAPAGTPIQVGSQPNGLCFDGRYVWVVHEGLNNVLRFMAATPTFVEIFHVGQSPRICSFDGTNIWVTNHDSNDVTVLRASDGSLVRTVTVGTNPVGIAFEGANMWVTNAGSNDVTKIRVSDGQVLGTFSVGQEPRFLAFDGFHMWVTNHSDDTVTKLRVRDGALIGTYDVGAGPRGITFDGSDMWVVNGDDDSISRL